MMAKTNYKILIPKEHGTWFILLVPYCIGVAIHDGFSTLTLLGFIGILMLFISRPSLFMLIKRRYDTGANRLLWLNFLVFFFWGLSIYLFLFLKYHLWKLIYLGIIGLLLFFIYTLFTLQRKERTIFGELMGILLLTFTSTLGFYLASEQLSIQTFVLWKVSFLYFATSVFYIKMKIMAFTYRVKYDSEVTKFMLTKNIIVYLTIVIIILLFLTVKQIVPPLVIVAFFPMFTHIIWNILILSPTKFRAIKEGLIQIGLSLIFAVLITISY